jgi:bisphosphoglycerate-independent phosphoglycerate mutase (AlkP superfamily)
VTFETIELRAKEMTMSGNGHLDFNTGRVGMSFVERIEAKVRAAIREEVRIHPSKGKTLL